MKNLLICIPTFNRKLFIKKQLEKLSKLPEDKVDIVVFNNNSTDGTQQCIDFFSNNYSHIKGFRNKSNIGYNGNILKIIEYAKNYTNDYKYLFILSDDDLININNLISVINKLNRINTIILLKWLKINYDASLTVRPNDDIKNQNFTNIISQTALISSYMYPMKLLEKFNLKELRKYKDNTFLHIVLIANLVKMSNEIILLDDIAGIENTNFEFQFDIVKTFCIDRASMISYLDKCFSTSELQKIHSNTTDFLLDRSIIWYIISYKKNNLFFKILNYKIKNRYVTKKTIFYCFKFVFSLIRPVANRYIRKEKNAKKAMKLLQEYLDNE